jgi:hypothetical protein
MNVPRLPATFDAEQVLRSALWMMASGEADALELLTEDVCAVTPFGEMHGRAEFDAQLADWREGFSNVALDVEGMALDGTSALVRWRLAADHTGVVLVNEDLFFEPTGRRVNLRLATQIEFRGVRICQFRHDYALDDLVDQLRPELDD